MTSGRHLSPDPTSPTTPGTRRPLIEGVLLALLLLVPVGFSRWTEEAWEFPKGVVLTIGAMILAWWGVSGELSRIRDLGIGPWTRSALGRLQATIRRDPLTGAVLLLLVSSNASAIASPNSGMGIYGAQGSYLGLLATCAMAIVYFASRSLRGNVARFSRLCTVSGIAAAIAAAYGIVQFAGRDPLLWGTVPYLRGMRRAAGTLGQPNLLGAFLVVTLPLVVWRLFRSKSLIGRVAWAGVVALSLAALGMTFSRSSWAALAGSAIIGAILLIRTRPASRPTAPSRSLVAVTVGLVVVLAIMGLVATRTSMGSHLLERVRDFASLRERGIAARLEGWRLGLQVAAHKPILGVGTDQFGMEFPAYRTVSYYRLEFGAIPATAHSVALNLLATQGVLGLFAGFLIFVFAIGAVRRVLRRQEPETHGAALAATTALTAFLLWSLGNYTVAALGTLAAALMGWVAAAGAAPEESAQPARALRRSVWAIAVAGLVAAAAMVPLVVRPILAQVAKGASARIPVGAPAQIEALKRAARFAPWEGRYPHHLASSYLNMATLEEERAPRDSLLRLARTAEEKAIQIDGRAALFHASHGWILTQLVATGAADASVDQVRSAFDKALERDPVNPDILELSAEAWTTLGRYGDARLAALRCLEIEPESARPLSTIGFIAMSEKRWGAAADTLRLAAGRDWRGDTYPQAMALANLSATYIQMGRFEEGRVAADRALQVEPRLEAAMQNRDLAIRRLAEKPARPK